MNVEKPNQDSDRSQTTMGDIELLERPSSDANHRDTTAQESSRDAYRDEDTTSGSGDKRTAGILRLFSHHPFMLSMFDSQSHQSSSLCHHIMMIINKFQELPVSCEPNLMSREELKCFFYQISRNISTSRPLAAVQPPVLHVHASNST